MLGSRGTGDIVISFKLDLNRAIGIHIGAHQCHLLVQLQNVLNLRANQGYRFYCRSKSY